MFAMPPTDADYAAFAEELRAAERVLITTHVRPDGDALGTTAAVHLGLRHLGVASRCAVPSPVPPKYAFLYDGIDVADDPAAAVTEADLILVCDTGTWSQLPGLREAIEASSARKLVLDHHLTQEDWPDRHLVDTTAGAAAEVAMLLLRAMNVPLTADVAGRLYAAMATDTGWFSYSNTTPRTMRLAADCVEAGAIPDDLNGRLFRNERPARLRLVQRCLASLDLLADDRLAVMSLSADDYRDGGADVSDGEGLINLPMEVGSVTTSLLIGENPTADAVPEGVVKVSLRSKPGGLDCAAFLKDYGGGGHARAAGARVDGTLADVRARVVRALLERL